jgi:pectate disaccharide-lyase
VGKVARDGVPGAASESLDKRSHSGAEEMKSIHCLRHWYSLVVALLVLGGAMTGGTLVFAAGGTATSSATPSNATPGIGDSIVVTIAIDVSGVTAPDNALGSFTGTLGWNPAVLAYSSNSGIQAGFTGVVNATQAATGHIIFNGAKPSGATGNNTVLTITFDVVGAGTSALDLGYSAMSAASTFANLLPLLTVNDGQVVVTPAAQYTLTTAVSPVGGGSTNPAVGPHTYAYGTVVAVTATPAAGYTFSSWSGACTGTSACSVTMNANKTVTANFIALTGYTLYLPMISKN